MCWWRAGLCLVLLAGCSWLLDRKPREVWPAWAARGELALAGVWVEPDCGVCVLHRAGQDAAVLPYGWGRMVSGRISGGPYLRTGFRAGRVDALDFAGVCGDVCGGVFSAKLVVVAEEDFSAGLSEKRKRRLRRFAAQIAQSCRSLCAFDGVRIWLKALERAGEVQRVKAAVSPVLEMAAIADRASKSGKGTSEAGGPALLFENVTGYKGTRVLMNQFGSSRRMKLALEVESLDEVAGRIESLLHPAPPSGLLTS